MSRGSPLSEVALTNGGVPGYLFTGYTSLTCHQSSSSVCMRWPIGWHPLSPPPPPTHTHTHTHSHYTHSTEVHFNHTHLSPGGQRRLRRVRGGRHTSQKCASWWKTRACLLTRTHTHTHSTFITLIRWAISHTLQSHYRLRSPNVWPCH